MIPQVVGWAVRRRALVLGLTGVFALAAGWFALQLKLDAMPDVTTNQVLVLTRAPGLTPEEVERRVTRPIEAVLGGLPGLVEQRSLSRYGISSVTVVFRDEVDPYRARQIVQERLNIVGGALPAGVETPELGPLTGGLGEIFHFTLSSASRTPGELLELATYKVAPLLRSVPGVVEVNTWGGQRRTLEVEADPLRLAQRGLTLDRLREALERASGSVAGAYIPSSGKGQALLRGVARPATLSDLGHAIVAEGQGQARVRVGDVAQLHEDALPRIGAATVDGRGETVYLMAQMLRGENALEVMAHIHRQMPEVRQVLPPDVKVDLVYDRAVLVTGTLYTVGKNLLEGGLLVVSVLFLMLGSLRAGLLVALAIPLSMLGATLGMVVLGIPGNLMSLGAIDFGLLVDGAVVMVEHVFHRLRPKPGEAALGGEELRQKIGAATQEVSTPMFYSVLIILLVYVPVVTLTGVDGKMFRPMAMTVVFALATSLILSLTFIPAATSLILRQKDVPARDPLLVRLIERFYGPLLHGIHHFPKSVALVAVALLGLGGWLYARSGSEFIPQLDEGDMVIQSTRAPDISLDGAIRDGGRMEAAILAAAPEVIQVVSRIGSPAVATDIMGIEMSDVFVALKPKELWRPGLTRNRLIEEIQRQINARVPGSDPSFTQPIQMRFNELLAGAVTDVAVSIYGDDLKKLRQVAEELAAMLRREPGAVDVRIMAPPDVLLAEVRPRPLEASQVGLSVAEVLQAVQAVRTGVPVGATYDGPVRIPIMLRMSPQTTAHSLGDLSLPTPGGGLVPLSRVAQVEAMMAPSLVNHMRGERRLVVGFNVRGVELGVVVAKAQEKAQGLKLPEGYRVTWGGQYENLKEASARLLMVVPAVLVLILVVLLFAFRRLRPALIIFTHVPFACVGGIIALAVRGMPVSISAAVGFIALSGIAVLNGVVLLSRIVAAEAQGVDPGQAATDAAQSRARPVLMTALVAALGFIPMTLATGIGAEVQRPLATVVVGGLVTSTVLTLLILPTLYPWMAARRRAEAG